MNSVVGATMRALVEGFSNPSVTESHRQDPIYAAAIAAILSFVISVLIISLVGLWLWNFSVVPLFEFARPAKSVFQILGLMVFISLVHPY
jgi:type IV secretory pathway TrbD component